MENDGRRSQAGSAASPGDPAKILFSTTGLGHMSLGEQNPRTTGRSGRHRGHQLGEPDDIEHSPEIISECGQAELSTDFRQATHQKSTLIHPLLDRPKRVFDRLAPTVENAGTFRQSLLHPIQHASFSSRVTTRNLPVVQRARIGQSPQIDLLE
jgi:hypothetical protein